MPEGPEIRRAADQVEKALKNRTLLQVEFGHTHLKPFEAQLKGSKVQNIATQGKAMLTQFNNGLTLYTHNQLYGRWYVGDADFQPDTHRTLRVKLQTRNSAALLFSASTIEVLSASEVQKHPFISRLGPDILHPSTDSHTLLEILRDGPAKNRQLGYLLTDQTILAGIGNYLRCEALFIAHLHPTARPTDCTTQQLTLLAETILAISRQSYATDGVTNDLHRAQKLMDTGASFEQARFYLFRRDGLPCYRCGRTIKKVISSGQTSYICEGCQDTGTGHK